MRPAISVQISSDYGESNIRRAQIDLGSAYMALSAYIMEIRYVLFQVTDTGYRYSTQTAHSVTERDEDIGSLFAIARDILASTESISNLVKTERFRAYLQHIARFALLSTSGIYLIPTSTASQLPYESYPSSLPYDLMDTVWRVSIQQRLDENQVPVTYGSVFPGAQFAVLNFLDSAGLPGLSDALYLGGLRGPEELWSVYFPSQRELPDPGIHRSVVLTGGEYTVYDASVQWTAAAEAWVRTVVASHATTKLLGLCYGHQLIAQALGGRVTSNPSGKFLHHPELVTFQDTLASFLRPHSSLYVSECHNDSVVSLPAEGRLLGRSESTEVEAWGLGSQVICTQGHPEFSSSFMRLCYLPGLEAPGILTAEEIRTAVNLYERNSPNSELLVCLRQWLHSSGSS